MLSLTETQISQELAKGSKKRKDYFVETVLQSKQIWIITDKHGAVMLTSEDEDFIPIWPNREFAEKWCNGEWQHCEPLSIELNHWFEKWSIGLEDDEIQIIVFPDEEGNGEILAPYELDMALQKN